MFFVSFLTAEEIRIEPDSYWLKMNTWEKTLTSSLFIESSLAASGLDGEALNFYIEKYNQLVLDFNKDREDTFITLSIYEKGEFILNWAHENILKNYIEEQTLMNVLIDTGNYNCVSSAVFYLILSRAAGINVEAVETSDHAFCTIKTEDKWIDVETTTSYGFNPGIKKEFQQSFNQTGYTYVPPGNYRTRQRISDREMVALILQNRMSVLQKYNLHDQAVGLAVDRWTLAVTDNNYKDMNDAFRNWSAVLNNKSNYTEAYYFLSNVSFKYNLININNDLLYDLTYNHIISLTNNENYNTANEFLLETKSVLNKSDQNKLENLVTRSFLSDTVRNEIYEISLPLVREAYNTNSISKSEWHNWITVLHQNKALEISNFTDWWEAWQFLKKLPPDEKNLASIKKSTDLAHDNWSFDIHNNFADLYNIQDFKGAEMVLLNGLNLDPDNKYLTQDLNDLKKLNF
jgi:hypothetical protein